MIAFVMACLLVMCVQHKPTPEEAFGPQGGTPPEVQMLVDRVKQQLAAVDEALQLAADADQAADDLEAARKAHLSVIRDIEELIKQVKYCESQSQSRSGSAGSGRPQDGSTGEPPPQAAPRESDGEAHSQPQAGSQPPQPEPANGTPESGRADQRPPGQEDARKPPPPPETGRYERQDTDARWGLLPPKIQERLMNLHVDDMPERYRVWMDAYIRKLNALEQGPSGS
jgi:hypothetical protein